MNDSTSRAEPSVGYCLSSTSSSECSAAPAGARDRDRSLRSARPDLPAATVLVLGLLLLGAPAAEAQTPVTLVSNQGQTADDSASTSGNVHAQLFHTGAHAAGYTFTGMHVSSEDTEGDDFDVEICEEDGTANEFPSTTASDCTALTAPASFAAGLLFFDHTGLALSANTNYVVVITQRGTGSVELNSTPSGGEEIALSGWSIKDTFYWNNSGTWTVKSGSNEALRIIVYGYAVVPVVVTAAPVVLAVNKVSADGTYNLGDTISLNVLFNAAVTVSGTPQLALEIGTDTTPRANYASGSGTQTLQFDYEVVAGDEDTDGIAVPNNALTLNGGTISAGGTPANVSIGSMDFGGILVDGGPAVVVTAPTVTGVALTSDPGLFNTYGIGDAVEATVTFSAAVDITGTPQLELDFAGTAKAAACTTGTNTTTMVCSYTVPVGDSAPNGVGIAANKLTGGTIYATGSTTTSADLTHTEVAIAAGHKVDGIRPTLVTTGSDAPTTSTDGTTVILTFSEDIGGVSRDDITIQANSVTAATARSLTTGTRVELTLTTALTATATNLTVALAADAVFDAAANGILAVAATAVTNAITANAPPEFSSPTATREVPENTAENTNIGTALPAATDADNDPLTYTLEGADAASFGFDPATRQLSTKSGVTYDYETKPSYSVTLKADDDNGGSDTLAVTITVTDVEEPPDRPAAPSVTATAGTTDSLSVNWTAPSNTGPAIDNYDLQYREGTGGSWINGPQNVSGTSATIGSLTEGTSYQVQVLATNAEGDSPWSLPGSGQTGADPVEADRAALEALYNATGGATWTDNTNWLSAEALSAWHGVSTDATGRVTVLYLTDNNLSGEIPAELGDLTSLQNLYLWQNSLSGEIPAELGGLTSLQILFLEDNNLSGEIPAELGGLTSVQSLYLAQNGLSGEIPAELGDLTNLQTLDLQNNNLSGEIPAELGDLTSLQNLFLRDNNLSGEIPAELGDLTSLQNLYLRNNNLSGEIPAELGDLASLLILDLQNNNLSGEIPAELGGLASLQNLYLAQNNLSGEIPAALGGLASLQYLYLWGNELSGEIPAALGDLTSLLVLDLARNNLSGEIPAELGGLTSLWSLFLWGNKLSGKIPAELGDLTNLFDLDLAQNKLSGEIPAELGNLANLEFLYLNDNTLDGGIPAELGGLTNLITLYLNGNKLSGEIPAALGGLANLRELDLARNELSGEIPAELGLTSLQRLYLQNNQLTGPIPAELGGLANLLYLSLWSNQLSGEIPAAVGVAADRGALEGFYNATDGPNWTVGTNWLTTEEPISAWHGVTTDSNGRVTRVVLSNNELTGPISVAVEQLENLEQLILSVNDELTGTIPVGLMNLSGLVTLNVSGTNVCTPTDAAFQGWLATVTFQGGTACEPPDAPENLRTMAGNARVTLAWTKGDDGGSTITKHQIQQKEGSAEYGAWMDIPDSAAGQKNQASYTVTGLTNGTNYTFQVRAVNDEGESDASVEATATPAVPPVTVSVTITAAEIVVDEGRNAEFTLLRSGNAGALEVQLSVSESGDMLRSPVPKRVTFPANEARVTLTVRTVNDGGDERDSVVTVTVGPGTGYEPVSANASASMTVRDNDRTPPRPPGGGGGGGGGPRTSAPGAPRNLTAVGGNGEAVLSWDAPSSDGGAEITDYEYRINRSGPWIPSGSTETTHTVTGLVNGTAYVFEVRAVNRVGKGRASNRAEATPEVFTLDFAHFANGDGLTSDLVFVNVGTHPVRPALYFYDTEGQPMAADSVVEITGDLEIQEDGSLSIQTAMEPLGELTISTHGQEELVSGSARVIAGGPIGGVLRFDLPEIGVAGVGASPPVRDAVFPVRRQEGGINTGVAVHNLESSLEIVRCELMREGALHDAVSLPLAANGQTSWFIDTAFSAADTTDFSGSVRCDAEGPGMFTAVALELDAATRTFTTLPVFPVSRLAGGRAAELDFAHFANGEGIISDLVFVNLSTERSRPAPTPFHTDILPLRPMIYFYDTEGALVAAESVVDITGDLEVMEDGGLSIQTEMEPLGVLTISTHGRGDLVTGSVRVAADEPIGGGMRFDLPEIGVAGVGASEAVSDALFPVRRQEGGINTGVAIHNLSEEAIVVTCRLMSAGVVLEEEEIPLEANGQFSWLIEETFTTTDTSDFVGSVRCTAPGEGMFTGLAMEFDAVNRIFTTLPVVPVPERMSQE